MSVSHVADCPDLGPQCFDLVGPAPVPYNHRIDQVMAETVLDASLGLTDWLALEARWSLRVADVNPSYSELDGSEKSVPDDIHHHNETLVDITDPWLLARVAAQSGDFSSHARLGLSFPIGRTEPNPYALGRQGRSHQHLQAGAGTFVPIVGFGVAYAISPVTISLGGVGFFSAAENANGFRAPVRLYGSHRVSVAVAEVGLVPFVEGIVAHEGEEYWDGAPGLEGSNVRTEVYLGGGVLWRFYEAWSLEAAVRGRLATLTDAPTFEQHGLFSLAIATSFDLWDTKAERARTKAAQPQEGNKIRERHQNGVTEFEKE